MTAGLLLAAGQSRRMGGRSKLLLPVEGEALVRRAAASLVASGLSPVLIVLGPDVDRVRDALEGLCVEFVENPCCDEGMGTSIAAGVSSLGPEVDRVVIALGDMPRVSPASVGRLLRAFERAQKGIAVPTHAGRRGHPVLFDLGRYRADLTALRGEEGARSILRAHPEDVLEVPVGDPGVLVDVDTQDDYARLKEQGPRLKEQGRKHPNFDL